MLLAILNETFIDRVISLTYDAAEAIATALALPEDANIVVTAQTKVRLIAEVKLVEISG